MQVVLAALAQVLIFQMQCILNVRDGRTYDFEILSSDFKKLSTSLTHSPIDFLIYLELLLFWYILNCNCFDIFWIIIVLIYLELPKTKDPMMQYKYLFLTCKVVTPVCFSAILRVLSFFDDYRDIVYIRLYNCNYFGQEIVTFSYHFMPIPVKLFYYRCC